MSIPIIPRLAGRYMSRRMLQSALFVLGVALGVAVVVAAGSERHRAQGEGEGGASKHGVVGSGAGAAPVCTEARDRGQRQPPRRA